MKFVITVRDCEKSDVGCVGERVFSQRRDPNDMKFMAVPWNMRKECVFFGHSVCW